MKELSTSLLRMAIVLSLMACHLDPQSKYVEQARDFAKKQDWEQSVHFYEKAVKVDAESDRALEASREASRICVVHLKEDSRAAEFLRHVVKFTKDHTERAVAQRSLAQIYLEKLNDYPQAVIEINRALAFSRSEADRNQLRFMLARAYSFQRDFLQARSEVDQLLLETSDRDLRFRAKLLKAATLQNEKKHNEAIALFKDLLVQEPERSNNEQVALSLAVALEEQENFDEAIAVLEKVRVGYKVPEMIELKILRLKERKAQAPGARGLRK